MAQKGDKIVSDDSEAHTTIETRNSPQSELEEAGREHDETDPNAYSEDCNDGINTVTLVVLTF